MEDDLLDIFNDIEPIFNNEIIVFNDSFVQEVTVVEETPKIQQYVQNFEQLMNLYPREHPSHIHGIMLMANNNYEEAKEMLTYVTEHRIITSDQENSTVFSSSSNLTSQDSNISQGSVDGKKPLPIQATKSEPVNNEKIVELVPYLEPRRSKRGTIPASTHLKKVYKDSSSQFVKIKKIK